MTRFALTLRGLLLAVVLTTASDRLYAQAENSIRKHLQLSPRAATDTEAIFHLLPSEDEQEAGNAVPVLLRMTHE